jgi:hypothetical protein
VWFNYFLRISVDFNPENSIENHVLIVEALNTKLNMEMPNLNINSNWCADSLALAWKVGYNEYNFEMLMKKLNTVIGLVESEGFKSYKKGVNIVKFSQEWDEFMCR